MQTNSLGLIETWGHIPAVAAVDAGCKAASVTLVGYEEVRAGLVTIVFAGDVASVKTAVAAGSAAAQRLGRMVSSHVIARPDRQLLPIAIPPLPVSFSTEFEPPEGSSSAPVKTQPGSVGGDQASEQEKAGPPPGASPAKAKSPVENPRTKAPRKKTGKAGPRKKS